MGSTVSNDEGLCPCLALLINLVVQGSPGLVSESALLVIERLGPEDSSLYLCTATNSEGQAEDDVKLEVLCKLTWNYLLFSTSSDQCLHAMGKEVSTHTRTLLKNIFDKFKFKLIFNDEMK